MVKIIIIEKNSNLKETESTEDNIYKKCGYTKETNFIIHHTWEVKLGSILYKILFFGKNEGRVNSENKYDLPPPLDNDLFFGKCALVRLDSNDNMCDLNIETWHKIYEKLFGGFENLENTIDEDDDEEDELDNIPSSMKTKDGYLKDNFVIDENEEVENDNDEDDDEEEEEFNDDNEDSLEDDELIDELNDDDDNEEIFNEIGSELSEEAYLYSDED